MVNKQKRKGYNWQSEFAKIMNDNLPGTFKTIPGSGAIGTLLNEGLLTGDVVGSVNGIPKTFRVECKTGYGGSTQLTVKKEWLDKIRMEADSTYSIPVLACKFSGSRAGTKYFVILDIDTFISLIRELSSAKTS